MFPSLYDEIKLHLIITRITFCNYLRCDSNNLRWLTDYSPLAKLQYGVWCAFVLLLAWQIFPLNDGNFYKLVLDIIVYIIILTIFISVPSLRFLNQAKYMKVLVDLHKFEESLLFIGLKICNYYEYKLFFYLGLLILFSAVVCPIVYIILLVSDSVRDAIKVKLLIVCIFNSMALPKIVFTRIILYCKAINDALRDGLQQETVNCIYCDDANINRLNCVEIQYTCQVHRLMVAEFLYSTLQTLLKNSFNLYKFEFFIFVFSLMIECGIEITNVLNGLLILRIGFNIKISTSVALILMPLIALAIVYLIFDSVRTEFECTGSIIHKYYLKYSKIKGVKEVVAIFSMIVLDEPNFFLYFYNFTRSDLLNIYHSSVTVASLTMQFRMDTMSD